MLNLGTATYANKTFMTEIVGITLTLSAMNDTWSLHPQQ